MKRCLTIVVMSVVASLTGISLNEIYANEQDTLEFYSDLEKEESLNIVLAGSSFIRAINSNYVEEYLDESGISSNVYHLGVDMDLPSKRMKHLDDIIALDPDLVIYGIGHRIGINDGTHEQRYGCMVVEQSDAEYSAILNTKKNIDEIHAGIANQNNDATYDMYDKKEKILSKYTAESIDYEPLSAIEVLNMRDDPIIDVCSEFLTKEISYLKEILRILNDKNLDTVMFVTPHPKAYLDRIKDYAEEHNIFLLYSVGHEFGTDLYDISHKYEEEDIYRDFVHVARNSESKIYSDDISKIILNSMGKEFSHDNILKYKVTKDNNSLIQQWCNDDNNQLIGFGCDDKKKSEISKTDLPEWIKNNAGWWAEGMIEDDAFIDGIQFLIEKRIIQISSTTSSNLGSNEIPEWIKNNAGWWAEGMIDDDAFIDGIEYLVQNSIIQV